MFNSFPIISLLSNIGCLSYVGVKNIDLKSNNSPVLFLQVFVWENSTSATFFYLNSQTALPLSTVPNKSMKFTEPARKYSLCEKNGNTPYPRSVFPITYWRSITKEKITIYWNLRANNAKYQVTTKINLCGTYISRTRSFLLIGYSIRENTRASFINLFTQLFYEYLKTDLLIVFYCQSDSNYLTGILTVDYNNDWIIRKLNAVH